jgi:hypothetical protein
MSDSKKSVLLVLWNSSHNTFGKVSLTDLKAILAALP